MEALQKILTDLGDGMEINEALIRHTVPLGRLDARLRQICPRTGRSAGARPRRGINRSRPVQANADRSGRMVEGAIREACPALQQYAPATVARAEIQSGARCGKTTATRYFRTTRAPTTAYVLLAAAYRGLNDVDERTQRLEELAARAMPMQCRRICG